jgi:hypothetical protein
MYFDKHQSFAVGVAAGGSNLDEYTLVGLHLQAQQIILHTDRSLISIYPIISHQLQPRIGFRWATRVIGLTAFVTLGFTNVIICQCVRPTTRWKLFDIFELRGAPFILSTAGFFFGFMGLLHPLLLHHALHPGFQGR